MSTVYSRAYLLTKVLTANNKEVILYLYEGLLGYLQRAQEARQACDEAECGAALEQSLSILIELSSCLDYNHDGQMAIRLDSIYNYLIHAITLSNKNQDMEPIETSHSVITILYDAWRQAIESESQATMYEAEPQLRISA